MDFPKPSRFLVALLFCALSMFAVPGRIFALVQTSACTADIEGKNESELQVMLQQCEGEIAINKQLLEETQKKSQTLEVGVKEYSQKIKQAELQIKARIIKIKNLGDTIETKTEHIVELSDRIKKVQASIEELIRKTNEYSDTSPVEAMFANEALSDLFSNVDTFENIKSELRTRFLEAKEVKQVTEKEKKDLEAKQQDEKSLKFQQESEKRKAENYKQEQERILKVTKGQEAAYKKDIAEKERIKNEIRNRIFRTIGGKELRFEDALKLVQPYESRIGVDAAFVLAVLSQESASGGLIGKNIGKCTYNQTANNTEGTVMASSQKPAFLSIMQELNMNPDTTPVSCPIYTDGAYGGAMGPAQFMPLTWKAFEGRIASVLGVPNPSPFNSLDAFTGTALYLADAQDRCRSSFSSKNDIWRCAAAKYYAGLTASGSRLLRFMNPTSSYGYQVAKRAAQFQKDIDLLDL